MAYRERELVKDWLEVQNRRALRNEAILWAVISMSLVAWIIGGM
jgi:hypothetical protein